MQLDNYKEIDLSQEFFQTCDSDFLFSIYKFSVYRMTSTNLLDNEIEYYALLDPETSEIILCGIKWTQLEKRIKAETKIRLSEGSDAEQADYLVDALLIKLRERKIQDSKNRFAAKEKQENL